MGVMLLFLSAAVAAGAYRLTEKLSCFGGEGRSLRFFAFWLAALLVIFLAGEKLGLL